MKYIISLAAYLFPIIVFAQDAASVGTSAAASNTSASGVGPESLIVQLILIFVIFYFLLIRPHQKKAKEHMVYVSGLKKGDKVILSSGFLGTVTKAVEGDKFVEVEIADNVQVKVLRANVVESAEKKPETPKEIKK